MQNTTVTNEVEINKVIYVRKDSISSSKLAEPLDNMPFVLIRTYSAGVHFGYLKSQVGKEVELVNSRRAYYWSGAFTLSEMALKGVSKPNQCKFTVTLPYIKLTEAIEIINCTEEARKILTEVKVWQP